MAKNTGRSSEEMVRIEQVLESNLFKLLKGDTTYASEELNELLEEIQLPSTVARHAARAAMGVISAFERGYQMVR